MLQMVATTPLDIPSKKVYHLPKKPGFTNETGFLLTFNRRRS